jgi:hypothetical protein
MNGLVEIANGIRVTQAKAVRGVPLKLVEEIIMENAFRPDHGIQDGIVAIVTLRSPLSTAYYIHTVLYP